MSMRLPDLDLPLAYRKLAALEQSISECLASRLLVGYVSRDDYIELLRRFELIAEWCRSEHPRLLGDLPRRTAPDAQTGFDMVGADLCQGLLRDTRQCIRLLRGELPATPLQATVEREGIFFKGQYFDASAALATILVGAKQRLDIIDGYLDDDVLQLLSDKDAVVTVRIITRSLSGHLRTLATKFNQQYGGLHIRASEAFHDRFLAIDETDYYHLGASIKGAGNRGFMFSRIEEPLVIGKLRTEWQTEWDRAQEVVRP